MIHEKDEIPGFGWYGIFADPTGNQGGYRPPGRAGQERVPKHKRPATGVAPVLRFLWTGSGRSDLETLDLDLTTIDIRDAAEEAAPDGDDQTVVPERQ